MRQSTIDAVRAARVIPVIDLADPDGAHPLAEALLRAGARIAELTLRSATSIEVLREFAAVARDLGPGPSGQRLLVAAGTVLSPAELDAAHEAGAELFISPGATDALRTHASENSVDWIPGVSSASQIMDALDAGFRDLKFFPAEASGGTAAVSSLLAPFRRERISLMPTGGITAATAGAYLAIDGVAAVGGSWMVASSLLSGGRWQEVEQLMREALQA